VWRRGRRRAGHDDHRGIDVLEHDDHHDLLHHLLTQHHDLLNHHDHDDGAGAGTDE
jgi:hypothetical protein